MKQIISTGALNIVMSIAMLTLLITAFLPLLNVASPCLRWIFAAAAIVILAVQILTPAPASDLRSRRLARMNVWSAVLYCMSALCLFVHDVAMQQSWVAFLLAGAVLQIYAALMLGKLTQENKK